MKRQAGFALFAPLLLGAFAAAGWMADKAPARQGDAIRQARALAAAREALIARAANDANRPGSLPCPDQTASPGFANRPGDGKADMLVGNHCPSYLGRLPWITLDIPPPRDQALETLWYVAAPGLRDDDSAEPVNSSSPTGLSHAGQAEVAALLIAPGAPLAQQRRPSHAPGDYLEGWLDNAPTRTYWTGSAPSNDQILVIHRDELMTATMTRVAQTVRHCLQRHAAASGRLPWPAPLASVGRAGWLGARFGRLPVSQPEESAEKSLAELRARHRDGIAALAAAGDTASRQAALTHLAAVSRWIANRLGSHRQVAAILSRQGKAAAAPLAELAHKIANALSVGRLPASDGNAIRQSSAQILEPLTALGETLPRYGLDALAWDAQRTGAMPPPDQLPLALGNTVLALQTRCAEFAALDGGLPRPAVEQLLTAAAAILPPLNASLDLARLIDAHGQALDAEAIAIDSQFGAPGRQSIAEAASILASLRAHPTAKNRQLAEQALADTLAQARRLADGLDQSITLSGAKAASAWPMVWAADECDFLADETGWWQRNAWHDTLFYQADDPLDPRAASLAVDGKRGLALVVLAAGRPLHGQGRPSLRIEDYLEGPNAAASRNGEALTPPPGFSTAHGNDRIAY